MSWDGIRATLQWAFVLALVIALTAGATAARWWAAKDALLTSTMHARLEEVFPDCDAEMESLRVVDLSHLELTQFRLLSRSTGQELVRVPRLVVTLNGDLLREHHRVLITHVMLQSPELSLLRDAAHNWNWSGFQFELSENGASPTWEIRNARVLVGFQSEPNGAYRNVTCQGIQLSLEPESHGRYALTGQGLAEAVGQLTIDGLLDASTGEWRIGGKADEIRLGDPLLELASTLHPPLQGQMVALRNSSERWSPVMGQRIPIRTADLTDSAAPRLASNSAAPPAFLMRGDVQLKFELGRRAAEAPLTYEFSGSLKRGELSDWLLGRPLSNIEAGFLVRNDRIQIDELRASHADSSLYADGTSSLTPAGWEHEFDLRARQLPLGEEVRGVLPEAMLRYYDLLRPSGMFNIDVSLQRAAAGTPSWTVRNFEALNCRMLCDYFRYPVEEIHGTIRQNNTAFQLDMTGVAAGRPVKASGLIDPANPNASVDLAIETSNFPITPELVAALGRDDQKAIRGAIKSLNLRGNAATAKLRLLKGIATGGQLKYGLVAEVRDASLRHDLFPYAVENASGTIRFDPSRQNAWIFEQLRGTHGPNGQTRVAGRATFDLTGPAARLDLRLGCLQLPLNQELLVACRTAHPQLANVWAGLQPDGQVDVDEVQLAWTAGESPRVSLNGVHVINGGFKLAAFPYHWRNVNGVLHWVGNTLTIHTLDGFHGDTYMRIEGSPPAAAPGANGAKPKTATIAIAPDPEVSWAMSLDDVTIRKLHPDDELKRSLPPEIAQALNAVRFQGPVDLTVRNLEMKGWATPGNPVTAYWTVNPVSLFRNQLTAGMDVSELTGNVYIVEGQWDGRHLKIDGFMELESARALDMPHRDIRGPFRLDGNRLTIGTPQLSRPAPVHNPANPLREKQLVSNLYGGRASMNLDVDLSAGADQLGYELDLAIADSLLDQLAMDWRMPFRLQGKVNGALRAAGKGTSAQSTYGGGWVQVAPAALGELPVIAQVLSALSFRPAQPGEPAFNYAYSDFELRNGEFVFSEIQLIGNKIGLGGVGRVGFAGPTANRVDMDFYSKNVNRLGPFKPVVDFFSNDWVKFKVSGSLATGVNAEMQPNLNRMTDPIPTFLQSIEPGAQNRAPPRGTLPPLQRP